MPRFAAPLLLILASLAGCARCGKSGKMPEVEASVGGRAPGKPAPAATTCAAAHEQVVSCHDTDVPFPGERVTVRLCRLRPRDLPGDPAEGATRAELRVRGKPVGCVKLEDVGSLSTICSGPAEASCIARVGKDNLARTDRFWAPKSSKQHLLVFFGEVLDSDLPSIEIVRFQRGAAQSVFHAEPGRTDHTFVFSRLEDVDSDGVPELLGWERPAELEDCQPYIPLAVFKLRDTGFVRDDKLMEAWAVRNDKAWHGPNPDDSIRECEDDEPAHAQAPTVVRAPRPQR